MARRRFTKAGRHSSAALDALGTAASAFAGPRLAEFTATCRRAAHIGRSAARPFKSVVQSADPPPPSSCPPSKWARSASFFCPRYLKHRRAGPPPPSDCRHTCRPEATFANLHPITSERAVLLPDNVHAAPPNLCHGHHVRRNVVCCSQANIVPGGREAVWTSASDQAGSSACSQIFGAMRARIPTGA